MFPAGQARDRDDHKTDRSTRSRRPSSRRIAEVDRMQPTPIGQDRCPRSMVSGTGTSVAGPGEQRRRAPPSSVPGAGPRTQVPASQAARPHAARDRGVDRDALAGEARSMTPLAS
jgi:hypothetical protein